LLKRPARATTPTTSPAASAISVRWSEDNENSENGMEREMQGRDARSVGF
jgi:hypothetical protein